MTGIDIETGVELVGVTSQRPAIDSAMLLALVSWETDFTELAAMGRIPTIPTMQKAKSPKAMTTSIRLKAKDLFFINSNFQVIACGCALFLYLFQ